MEGLQMWVANHSAIGVLVFLMFSDIITGFLKAFVKKAVASTISRQGVSIKLGMLIALGLCVAIQPYAGGVPLADIGSVFFIYTEALSIIENLGEIGVPLPPRLKEVLSVMQPSKKTEIKTTVVQVATEQAAVAVAVASQPSRPPQQEAEPEQDVTNKGQGEGGWADD
jgi:toxin secretion/phage lysis holin